MITNRHHLALTTLLLMLALPAPAAAFCGFYVSGGTAKLFNNATQVVMLRDGKTTYQSMQNNYEGPPQDFAMVVPVPVVLQKEQVKTLHNALFDKIDRLAAPRLVQYWEHDPCQVIMEDKKVFDFEDDGVEGALKKPSPKKMNGGVTIHAKFNVGEYNILILGAERSNGLERWLRANKYNIPTNAAKLFKPYVQAGMYFFVAKVDIKKVKKDSAGRYTLSPLRFHYDADTFALPIRLGLANAKGKQDLIVHILAKNQRYEVANYRNVSIPTNIPVNAAVNGRFGEFYAALLDRTLEENPRSVVTEYAWDASTCDPCPGPTLNATDYTTLGGKSGWGWTLTRLHARYGAGDVKDDLVFRKAKPIIGGRGMPRGAEGTFGEQVSKPSSVNNFQGRYIILNRWTGPITCKNPVRGRWGGPPASPSSSGGVSTAKNTAFAPRGKLNLGAMVTQKTIPGLKQKGSGPFPTPKTMPTPTPAPKRKGARMCATARSGPAAPADPDALALLGALLGAAVIRRRAR